MALTELSDTIFKDATQFDCGADFVIGYSQVTGNLHQRTPSKAKVQIYESNKKLTNSIRKFELQEEPAKQKILKQASALQTLISPSNASLREKHLF